MRLSRSSHDHLIIRGEAGGLKREGGLNNFLSLKRVAGVGAQYRVYDTPLYLKPVREHIAFIFCDCALMP